MLFESKKHTDTLKKLILQFFWFILTTTNASVMHQNASHGQEPKSQFPSHSTRANGDPIVTVERAQLLLKDNVQVATRDAGIVKAIDVAEGQNVSIDSVLLLLDDASYRAELGVANAQKDIAELESQNETSYQFSAKSAEVNAKVLSRSRDAANRFAKSITRAEIEQQDLEVEQAILSCEQALHEKNVNVSTLMLRKEQLKVAQLRLDSRQIKSPLEGTVAELLVQRGEWVAVGQPVARIINLKRLRVEALLDQRYAFEVEEGLPVRFEMTVGDNFFSANGKLTFVSKEINPVTEQFLVRAELDNESGKIKPGLKGRLAILPARDQ